MQEIRMCDRRPDRVVCHRTHPLLQGGRLKEWQELTDGLISEAKSTIYTHTSPDRSSRALFYRIRQLGVIPLE